MKMLILLLLTSVLCACSNKASKDKSSKIDPVSNTSNPDSTVNPGSDNTRFQPSAGDTGLYSIRLTDVAISLRQWDSTLNLEQQLGKPIKQKTIKLDPNSDTHGGSFTKQIEFGGLKLKLFSPPQNGKHFWIQEIILTSNKYKTTKGITIGDGFEKVRQAYPSIKKFPGENANMYYVSDQSYEKSMEMEFEKNNLKTLRLYYMIP